MKKLAAVLLALALFAPCALAESNFPVYQVRAPGSEATVYLFPSIHAADERAYPLSSIVQNAYSASDFLAVECDVIAAESDILTSLRVMQKIRLPAGGDFFLHKGQRAVALVRTNAIGGDLLPAGRQLIQHGQVEVAEQNKGQGAGNGGGRHDEQMGIPCLVGQHSALTHAKTVLLVDDEQTGPGQVDPRFQQGMGATNDLDASAAQGVQRLAAGLFGHG